MFDRSARLAFVIACVSLVLAALGFRAATEYLNVYLQKESVELREHFSTISRHLGDWQARGPDGQLDAATIESLGTDVFLDRTYTRETEDGTTRINFHLAYYTGMIDAIPHVPDRCMLAGGFEPLTLPTYYDLDIDTSNWQYEDGLVHARSGEPYPKLTYPHPITARPITVTMPVGEFALRTTEFQHPSRPDDHIFAGFFFIANGQATPSPYQVRALAFDKTDKYAYYCKVQFQMVGQGDFEAEEYVAEVSDLLDELLREVMRCLPDWPEVQSREETTDQTA